MKTEKKSERKHWDDFWAGSGRVSDVYDNDGRVSRHFSAVSPCAGSRILEVGAGSGRDGIYMAREGAEVVSLDYSRTSLEMIAGQLLPGDGVSLVCGDAFRLPFAEGTFDLVFHQGLLEHFRNPEEMIREHLRVLKKGGYILVDVPQRWHYYTPLKHLFISSGRWFAGWETEFSPRQLEGLLEANGFQVVRTYGEWLNPPIWYRMMRKGLMGAGVRMPMHPRFFAWLRRSTSGAREALLGTRWALYTTVVIGVIGRKN